jgi:hypothetical protein
MILTAGRPGPPFGHLFVVSTLIVTVSLLVVAYPFVVATDSFTYLKLKVRDCVDLDESNLLNMTVCRII